MHPIIIWVLVFTGPRPYPVETFTGTNAHSQCIQAQYDYGRDQKGPAGNPFKCRMQTRMAPIDRAR